MNKKSVFKKGYVLYVIVPMLFVSAYYLFLAKDRFVSEALVTVRQSGSATPQLATGFAALAGMSPSSKEDSLYLREYMVSLDMMNFLENKIGIFSIYGENKSDIAFMLYGWMNQEAKLRYYKSMSLVEYDEMTGLLKVRTEAFSPKKAHLINKSILEQSELFINEMSHKMSREQMSFAEKELSAAKAKYAEAKSNLIAFQNKHGVFDPILQAESKIALSEELDSAAAKKESELETMLSYLQPTAPQVVTLKAEIASLKRQSINKRELSLSQGGSVGFNSLSSKFEDLKIEVGFAEDAYKLSLAAVEKSRIDAAQKAKHLAVVQSSVLPEGAEYPRRLYNILTFFIILSAIYWIGGLIKSTIEDHKY